MDYTPLVSVIIPAYNAETTICRCMQSALALDPQLVEVIVVDDGSTDSTGELVDNLAEGRRNCLVVHQENAGRSRARNLGLSVARSPWITFLDADDIFITLPDPSLFLKQDYQSIWCGYLTNGDNPVLPRLDAGPLPVVESTSLLLSTVIDVNSPQGSNENGFDGTLERTVWATFYSKERLIALGQAFDPSLAYAEDLELNIRFLCSTSRYLALPLVTYDYREEDSGTMKSFDRSNLDDLMHFCSVIQRDLASVRSQAHISPLIGNEVIQQIRRAGRFGTLKDVHSVCACIRSQKILLEGLKDYSPPQPRRRLLAKMRMIFIKCHLDIGIRLMEQIINNLKNS